MAGVISLLEGDDAGRVERLWDRMEREFGVPRGFPGAVPHVSYHLGEYPADEALRAGMAAVARRTRPFAAQISGIGIFGGPNPVVYLAVARGPRLSKVHTEVRSTLTELGYENNAYYEPDNWLPHITIAQQNLAPEALPAVAAWLASEAIQFSFEVTNLALATETPDALEVLVPFPFGN